MPRAKKAIAVLGLRLQQVQPEGGVVVREVLGIQEACQMRHADTLAASQ